MATWRNIFDKKGTSQHDENSIEELLRAKAAIEEELSRFEQFRCIMFTDIKGSTAYFSKKGDKAGRTMVQKHNDMLFPIIETHGGKVIKTIGDAIMAAFDDSGNAVKSAVAMQKRLAAYNQQEPDPEEEIHIRIGINAGVGIIDPNDVFGNLVNVAARVEALADGDQIYITAAVYNSIEAELQQQCHFWGEKELRGTGKSYPLYEIVWQDKITLKEPAPVPFEVKVWTEKGTERSHRDISIVPHGSLDRYALGESITVDFWANRDCYVTLINIGPTGNITILFPNAYIQDNFIHANQTYAFPGKDHPFDFKLTGPAGIETIKAIVTLKPVKLVETDFSKLGDLVFHKVDTRDIEIVEKRVNAMPLEEWAEDICTFEVKES